MKSTLNRLEALEAELTPKQVILRLLNTMANFQSLDDYLHWCYTDEALAQIEKTRENMYEAIKRRTGSKDARAVNRACLKASQEFLFLYNMATMPSQKFDADRYRYLYSVSTLAHWLGSFWGTLKSNESLGIDAQELSQAKRMAVSLLVDLISVRIVVKAIARKYFDECPLLFKQQQVFLERLTAHIEQIIEYLNEAVELLKVLEPERDHWEELYVDIEELQAMAENKAITRLEWAEQEARLKLYEAEGKHDKAVRSFQQLIHSE